ncbi:MAG: DGQHR domain-containing protein [Nitrospiraceae bacterium]|nr:DGQHR domain-containing protein [Nitrospiraceae bacterium]
MLAYYFKLARLTGEFAKNDLLGELDVPVALTIPDEGLTVPALQTTLRGRIAYLFYAKPRALLATSYVARREKGKEQHYQRLIDKSRLRQIGAFLNDRRKRGFFANNVILNFHSRPVFKRLRGAGQSRGVLRGVRMGLLQLPKNFRAAWIIDGQHRLYGFTKAGEQARHLQVPVIGFQQLNQTKQAELFLEINRNQKAVPPDLIWDLEGEINPNSGFGVISNAVKLLNQDRPFGGMISIPFEGRGQQRHLKLGNICDGILDRHLADEQTESMKTRARNPLYDRSGPRRTRKLLKALRGFFLLCASVLRNDWSRRREGFFCTNNGINVLLRIYESCLAYYSRKPSKAELTKVLRVINKWLREAHGRSQRLEELRKQTSSEGGRADIAGKLLSIIEERLSLRGIAGVRDSSPDLASRSSELERQLAKFIAAKMEIRHGPDWLRTRTTADVLRRVQERRGSSTKSVDQYLTLGECMTIILRDDNWTDVFKQVFGKIFRGKEGFKVKFEDVISIRNVAVHRPTDLEQRDYRLFDLYEEDLRGCMRTRRKPQVTGVAAPVTQAASAPQ